MKKLFSMGIVLSALVVSISSCKKNNTAAPPPPEVLKNDINIASSATLGQYLANKQGLTLYMFANDADGVSSCTGGCEAIWPAFTADLTTAKLDAGLTASDFGTITTASGKKQVTYKGWPLHTYSPSGTDGYGGTTNIAEPAGSTKGDGAFGLWFIAKPDYTIMLANKQLKGLDGNNYKSDYTIGTGNTVYFTNGAGRTIYTFSVDSFNINKFTKADLSNNATFPIYEQEQIVVPSVLDKSLFGNITVAGKKQMTYKGWPLYHFGQDSVRGLTQAVSVPVAGKWPVAVKDMTEARR
jgi:predicted lipoprotein with Yx(FWY)xxD motif